MPVQRIVVGVDGSEASMHALAWAADRARSDGADLVAVHAVGLLEHLDDSSSGDLIAAEDANAQVMNRFVNSWCAPATAAGVEVRPILRDGPPVDVILAVAADERADLIVVGSRGAGGADQVLGSTSHRVASFAPCPVVIVPPSVTARSSDEDRAEMSHHSA